MFVTAINQTQHICEVMWSDWRKERLAQFPKDERANLMQLLKVAWHIITLYYYIQKEYEGWKVAQPTSQTRQCFLVTADVKISQTRRLTVDRQPGKSGHGQSTGGERPMKTHQHTSNQFKEKQKQCPWHIHCLNLNHTKLNHLNPHLAH